MGRWRRSLGFENNQIGLGHRRLAIIDLDKSQHNAFLIIYHCINGEIFNYLEIRSKLISRKIDLKQNQTLFLLRYAVAMYIELLKGMFALHLGFPLEELFC